jgi:hypothetical protein
MRVVTSLMAVVVIAFAACGNPSNIPTSRALGVFNIKDTTNGAGGYTISPTAVFWTASNLTLPNSQYIPDSCIDTLYYPPDTTTATLTTQLDAGSPIMVATSLATGSLTPDTIPGKLIVYKDAGAPIAHTPGLNVTFTVPGAAGGVEASTLTAKTAQYLSLGPIDPQPADSLHLTWNLQTPGTTAVNIALLYISGGGSTYNRQILCSLFDDGSYTMGPKTAKGWKDAYPNQKVQAFRWVTTYNTGSANTLLLGIAEFDTTKTTFP